MTTVMTRDIADCENSENCFHKYKKIIVTGHIIELYEMEKTPYQVFKKASQDKDQHEWIQDYLAEVKDRDLLDNITQASERGADGKELQRIIDVHWGRADRNITRTRNMVRRLALANFDSGSKFITFTFAENISEVSAANVKWRAFMQRMRRKYGTFKYMAVIEFQKRGAVHYHCIWDLPYIKKSDLAEIWDNGFIKINRIEHVDNVGAYIVKYMTKDLMDSRFVAQKSYQCSKGLQRPLELRGEEAETIIALYELGQKKAVFESSYTSEYLGLISYQEYNLKRIESQS